MDNMEYRSHNYIWDGMQELADANPMTPELRAKTEMSNDKLRDAAT